MRRTKQNERGKQAMKLKNLLLIMALTLPLAAQVDTYFSPVGVWPMCIDNPQRFLCLLSPGPYNQAVDMLMIRDQSDTSSVAWKWEITCTDVSGVTKTLGGIAPREQSAWTHVFIQAGCLQAKGTVVGMSEMPK
jgi:hypothetical protein